jgi:broad specificity phosphatase PhoE
MTMRLSHRLWFIRHGETDWNREGRLQGQRDIPLNAKGREQAGAVGRALRKIAGAELDRLDEARAFVCSPLSRARETMERARAAMGLSPETYALSDDLKELSFGAWEGLIWREVEARDPQGAAVRAADKWNFTPPGGESYAALADRLAVWLASVDRDLFVCSHGGVARGLMFLLGGVAPDVAAGASIHQGRALLFAGGRFEWLG